MELELDHSALGVLGMMLDRLDEIAKMLDRQASRDGIAYPIAADTSSVHLLEPNRFRHLATIYRKIGVRNRADATAFVYKSGLANT